MKDFLRSDSGSHGAWWQPAVCAALTFTLVTVVWGSLAKSPIGSDEAAYILQAKIFASGHWVAAGRPLPEFFQQFHVFVTPVLAGKYPPGHSMLLAVGFLFGLPGLVPALSTAITSGLVFVLARRFANEATAALTVFLATTSDIALRFNPSYFSETTTGLMLVLSWWAALRYWESARARWLVLCAAACAWGGITRPLTMLACGLPIVIAAVIALRRRGSWWHVFPAMAAVLCIGAVSALWNARVVGHWYRLPWAEYARRYVPSDRLGFGASPNEPAARLTAEEKATAEVYRQLHLHYTAAQLPATAASRAANIIRGTWPYGGLPGLAILFAFGVIPLAVFRMAVATILCLFTAYLFFAIAPTWTLYYLELQPPLAFLTAAGIVEAARQASRFATSRSPALALHRATLGLVAFLTLVVWLAVPAIERIPEYRRTHAAYRLYHERFQRAVDSLHSARSIVFVRYVGGHGEERLVENVPDLETARVWVVHDCGVHNAALLALAPDRVPYLYKETLGSTGIRFTITSLNGAGQAAPAERDREETC